MSDYLLIVRNRANEKAHPTKIDKVFHKGDVIEILPLGISPGNKAAKLNFFSYAKVLNVNIKDIMYLTQNNYSNLKDSAGKKYIMLNKRRYSLPDNITDSLSKNWTKPTLVNLDSISLQDKK